MKKNGHRLGWMLTLLLLAGLQGFAQLQTRTVHAMIDSIIVRNDSVMLLLDAGTEAGLSADAKGKVLARHNKAFDSQDYTELGFGKIVGLNRQRALLLLQGKASSGQRSIQKMDLVRFSYRPATAGRLFTELAARAIYFDDIYRDPMYELNQVISQGNQFPEDSLLQAMVDQVKETVTFVKPTLEPGNSLLVPLTMGRYKGKTVIEVMEQTTLQDVITFLQFVLSYPGKYMGYHYKFNETFATWVLNNAPGGSLELYTRRQELLGNASALQQWYQTNAATIRKEKLCDLYFDEVIAFNEERKYDSALLRIREGLEVATATQDTAGHSTMWQAWAQWYQDNEQYAETIRCTDSMIRYARLAGNASELAAAYFKKAFCQYKIAAYDSSHHTLALAEQALLQNAQKLKGNDSLNLWRKRHEYAGWSYYAAGSYQEAIRSLYTGIALNRKMLTESATENIASDYWYLGRIYKAQGFYEKSLQAFDSARLLYRSLGDEYNFAFTENDIGSVYYKRGDYSRSKAYHERAYNTLVRMEKWDNAGYAKSMLGSNLEMENDIPGAIASHQEAIVLRNKAGNREGQAFSWTRLGKLFERTGQKQEALHAYDSAAFYYAAIGDRAEQAQNLLNNGKVYENDKDFRKARSYYDSAATILKALGSRSGYVDALSKLGSVTWELDPEASARYYAECLNESRGINDQVNELYSMVNLGALAGRKNRFDSAQYWISQALPLATATKDPAMVAYCYARMGGLAENRLQSAEAFDLYRKAAATYDTLDKARYFSTQLRISSLFVSTGKLDSAAHINRRVIQEASKLGYKLELGDALIQQAFQYTLRAQYQEGLALADSAGRVYAGSGNRMSQASVYATKALQYMGLGRYAECFRHFEMADSLYALEKNDWERSTIANNTGVAHTYQGAYRKAITSFQQSLDLRPSSQDDESAIRAKANMAECYVYLKQYDTALQIIPALYDRAKQQQFQRLSTSMALLMTRVLIATQETGKALPWANEALAFAMQSQLPDDQAEAMMYLGILQRSSQPAKALENLKAATALADKYQLSLLQWEAWYELGEYYYTNNQPEKAIEAYKKSAALIDKNSSNIFGGEDARKTYQTSGKKPELYSHLISALTATGAVEEAWAFAQKTQEEAVKDLLGSLSTNATSADKAKALQRLQELQQKRNGVEQNIKKLQAEGSNAAQLQLLQQTRDILEKEYLNYVTDLVKTYPDIDGYFSKNVNPEDFKDIKENIPDSVAIVLYLLNGKQLLIFTATNQKIGVKEQLLSSELEPLVDQYTQALSNPAFPAQSRPLILRSTIKKKVTPTAASQSFEQLSQQLYSLLLAPIENEIKGYSSLCIIPNGKLSNLPFQCLGKAGSSGHMEYLIESHDIFYTNKLTLFLKQGRKDRSLASFTGFGNPDNSLESAGQEVTAIGKMLNTPNIYLQAAATESKAKSSLEQSKYIHFATHGVLNYTDFSSSYLKMAPVQDGQEDGQLRIDEIKALSISGCELVTLSACETAVNQELKKGWYISPANAFLVSSVRSVVASLWAVDDEATNLLMQEFYKNLPVMGKSAALRKAQATLSQTKGFEHPFYWGAFVLYGDWR
ncbi:MAG: CHAT domain-containing protein [Chitinophagaceae bacterium]|nr:CHAT domain-containing protein [Chitinophagaceae bacterium]